MFFDHLSLVFPPGERFFIASVRTYESQIAHLPELQQDTRRFYQQEALHGREHQRYNDRLKEHGYPVAAIDQSAKGILGFASKVLPKRMQLGVTCALEHFTALLAQVLLGNASILQGANPAMAALWRWHAAEENEHATVAYDVFHAVSGTYLERVLTMLLVTLFFFGKMFEHQARMMYSQGLLTSGSEWASLFRFFLYKPAVLVRLVRPYFAYYKPSFHPREIDCTDLLQQFRVDFANESMYRDHVWNRTEPA